MRFSLEQIEREILLSEKMVVELEKSMDFEQAFADYSMFIINYVRLVEIMLRYTYEKNGVEVDESGSISVEGDQSSLMKRPQHISLMSYPTHGNNCNFLPVEVKKYIEQMRLMRNEAAHPIVMTYHDFARFKELFLLFKEWFTLQYSEESQYSYKEQSELEKEIVLLNGEVKELERLAKTNIQLEEQLNRTNERNEELAAEIAMLKKELEKRERSNEILNQIASRMFSLEHMVSGVQKDVTIIQENQVESFIENQNQFNIVNEKLDIIHKELRAMASLITEYQGDITKLIDKYQAKEGDEKYEQLISEFTERIVDKISSRFSADYLSDEYRKECTEIKDKFKDTWDMLSENSHRFLITARVLYRQMLSLEDIADYSGVCILITKALEEEMHKRFFKGFLEFLQNKYPLNDIRRPNNYMHWHTSVYYLNNFGKAFCIQDYSFTLGTVIYICYKNPRGTNTVQQTTNNKRILEYSKACLFKSSYDETYIIKRLREIGDCVNDVTFKYRNRAAHTNQLKKVDAENCFNYVVLIEQILVNMLKEFNM